MNVINAISIQVSLNGYSFKIERQGESFSSGWVGAERIFTTAEFQKKYDDVRISLCTPKFTLIPKQFFNPGDLRGALSDVCKLDEEDIVEYVPVPDFAAVLLYSNSIGESLSNAVARTVLTQNSEQARVLPEIYWMLEDLKQIGEYNKIIASYADSYLYLIISQGRSLLLCNVYPAANFTTAEYFIFLAMKKLQLNPEVSSISFRTPLSAEEELSLYRYFKAVEQL